MTDTPLSAKNPISFRPSDMERKTLEHLAKTEGLSASEVLRRGLELTREQVVRARKVKGMPYYAMENDDPVVLDAIERAADVACHVLDGLMQGLGNMAPERDGIDSNFRGLLGAHLRAMLSGDEHARKSYNTPIKALFANYQTFGTVPGAGPLQGYTLMRTPEQVSVEPLYFSEGTWVELPRINVGGLFTSRDFAVTQVLKHMRANEESVRQNPMLLVLIDFSTDIVKRIC
jgi:hypothetical protein